MKSATLAFRKALVSALDGIVYRTKAINVFEEVANPTTVKKIQSFNVNGVEVQAYIVVLNQTANDISAKCLRQDQVSAQIQIMTLFPIGTGGSTSAEEISELVMDKLFTVNDLSTSIVMPEPFFIWKSLLESTRNIPFETEVNQCWVHNMTLIAWIGQN